jgi:rhamnosyltransferase
MTKIISIIVTFNPDLTCFCKQLDSITSQVAGVIVIDNGSANYDQLRQIFSMGNYSNLTFIHNDENIGLAEAQNIGIGIALSREATHVAIFDQDSVPELNFFDNLLTAESKLINSGILFSSIGPSTYDPVSMADCSITQYVGPFIKRVHPNGDVPVEATFIIASGSLTRAEVFKQVGLMRGELFIDYIDVEWCFRARSKGLRCFVFPLARMSHQIGDKRVNFFWRTISAHSPLRRYYLLRNSFYITRLKYIPFSYKLREVVLNTVRVLFFLYVSQDRKKYLKYVLLALRDGFSGSYGKLK